MKQQQALARLLQLLLHGEHSAALAFEVLGRRRQRLGETPELLGALQSIAAEERGHTVLLSGLARELPAVGVDASLRAAADTFFHGLASRDCGVHFARIAALDSAVCLLLATLRKAQPALFHPVLQKIAHDEARHVALATHFTRRLCPQSARRNAVAATREQLAALLQLSADDLEALHVAPEALLARVRKPPRFLHA